MPTDSSAEARIVRAFGRIDDQHGGPLIAVLRRRLVGELFGDSEVVAATLDDDFELVMHTGGTTATLPGSAVVQGVEMQRASGVLMWTEFDDLVTENNVVACSGLLCSLLVDKQVLTTMPVSVFLRFTDDRMTSEVAFMGEAKTEVVKDDSQFSLERLRTQLDPEKDN